MAAATRRPQTMRANNAGVLPQDAIYEILLRIPARSLCRFRAVCHSWRSLISDPSFASAHAARHRSDPLFAVCVAGGTHGEVTEIKLLDTCGHMVKRVMSAVPASPLRQMLPHLDLVLLRDIYGVERHPLRVLNPATGAISILPDDDISPYSSFVFGRATADSTGGDGEYKVLSLTDQCCKVLTIDCSSSNGRWRAIPRLPFKNIELRRGKMWPRRALSTILFRV
ncbi:unnamed protein product [Urochloa humidicola]